MNLLALMIPNTSALEGLNYGLKNKLASINITTPDSLLEWMNSYIEYDHCPPSEWKLKSPNETYQLGKGNCHDQSLFATTVLTDLGFTTGQLFFIEGNIGSKIKGNAHTLTWFKADMRDYNIPGSRYYWFEHSWEDYRGIRGPYKSLNHLKEAVIQCYDKDHDINSHKFDGIMFGTDPVYRIGMSPGEYVKSWKFNA